MITEAHLPQHETAEQAALHRLENIFNNPLVEGIAREFGFPGFQGLDLGGRVGSYAKFTRATWDFRKGQERWNATESTYSSDVEERIFKAGRNFGDYNLVDSTYPQYDRYDFATILGGGNDSPLLRARYLKEQMDTLAESPKFVFLLGSARKVKAEERPRTDTYAPGAHTEFDLMNAAGERVFELDQPSVDVQEVEFATSIKDRAWKARVFTTDSGLQVVSVCAPMIEGQRRVNTGDTCLFLNHVMKDEIEGKRGLNVTHAVYTAFQDLDLRRLIGIPNQVELDTIGFDAAYGNITRTPSQVLQEMTSAGSAAKRLSNALSQAA